MPITIDAFVSNPTCSRHFLALTNPLFVAFANPLFAPTLAYENPYCPQL